MSGKGFIKKITKGSDNMRNKDKNRFVEETMKKRHSKKDISWEYVGHHYAESADRYSVIEEMKKEH